jgi:hypothetical protein
LKVAPENFKLFICIIVLSCYRERISEAHIGRNSGGFSGKSWPISLLFVVISGCTSLAYHGAVKKSLREGSEKIAKLSGGS